jgi:XTP/dITP diphosphohydrolase
VREIVFATTNNAKIEEIERVLTRFGFTVTHAKLEIEEPYGLGLEAIAKAKALNAHQLLGKPLAAIDTGFYINSLDGYPGDHVGDAIKKGLDWIISSVEGKDRTCSYKNCLAYMDETLKEPVVFESELVGTISDAPKGTLKPLWCPIHRIFVPEGKDKTLAEIAETDEGFIAWREERYYHSTSYKLANWLLSHSS